MLVRSEKAIAGLLFVTVYVLCEANYGLVFVMGTSRRINGN